MHCNKPEHIVIAITGASGCIYAKRLIKKLENTKNAPCISIIMSEVAKQVWKTELGVLPEFKHKMYHEKDFMAPFASGSSVADSMVVIPCTMGSLGKIAHGIADNLITRAADVILKEKKQLIMVPRETPLNLIHIENMKLLSLAGATIIPACPSFYAKPSSIHELVDTIVDRVLDHLGYASESATRW
ncbi:MAG: UbiX family flavin prenyltransferase [Candidatus Delongbacteria bacterium]|jgi:4-hydroxy-3-polyprenylbenzoate decarboxylase|nr:UbiX family flavin prenyltransferase [Candidatus Delongbacteria bacterium]